MGLTQDKEDGPIQNESRGAQFFEKKKKKSLFFEKAEVEPWQGAEETQRFHEGRDLFYSQCV